MVNNQIQVKVKRVGPNAILPTYAHAEDAGMDLYSCTRQTIYIELGRIYIIPTGIAIELPEGYEAQVRPRSGLASVGAVVIPGTIDAGYRGEIAVTLYGIGPASNIRLKPGDRIAQLVIAPVAHAELIEVDELTPSELGKGGFGSMGVGSHH